MKKDYSTNPIAQMPIAEIARGCIDVPDNVATLVAAAAGKDKDNRLIRLLNGLQNIVSISCTYKHEKESAEALRNREPEPAEDRVKLCEMRPNNSDCGHLGIKSLEDAVIKRWGLAEMEGDPVDMNNPGAKTQCALALVLAIGNHNEDASKLMDDLLAAMRKAARNDEKAEEYHYDYEVDDNDRLPEILRRQKQTGQIVLTIAKQTLAMLEEDMVHLADPTFTRKPSGKMNDNIGKITGFNMDDPSLHAMMR